MNIHRGVIEVKLFEVKAKRVITFLAEVE